jgi:PP-loop superfamily ATP-utilizing enzyme
MVEAGEAWVRSLGFRIFRVRHLVSGDAGTAHASVEIAPEELEHAHALFSTVRDGLLAIGYHGATLKSEGYRGAGQT